MPKSRTHQKLFGFSVTRVLYRLAQLGWKAVDAERAIRHLLPTYNLDVKTFSQGITDGKREPYAKQAAELTPDMIRQLSVAAGVTNTRGTLATSPDRATIRTLAADLAEPPTRVPSVVSRIVRDTEKANWVKSKHNNLCQLCRKLLLLPDGKAYAEAHHIRPLGEPHRGPDMVENIICVCPNCHALCDLGTMRLTLAILRQVEGHVVGQQFLDHHNKQIYAIRWGRSTPG